MQFSAPFDFFVKKLDFFEKTGTDIQCVDVDTAGSGLGSFFFHFVFSHLVKMQKMRRE